MEGLIRRLMELGIDVNELLLDALGAKDPEESSRERISIAEKYMRECEEYVNKGDAAQASEKAYKAAEEVIKALAEKFRTPEYDRFLREGRWYTYLLSMASKTLAKSLGDWVIDGWNAAYDLHVWGFHEGKLTIDYVKVGVNKVRKMLDEAKEILLQQGSV
ncbi:PaREP8 domain containing protein [Vulcanisaeta moutnovskia 768-28]|uniref:PaREP8 domain containing protein n=1 Tax=Vulcanisaeta moutnovskia (strain 768-28) TaxID=985053 RepID=F0QUT2_VULM7|nr:PaREP1 family protein [Vulcanisaeta moutnovskia]ADY01914.1 PaREP8 domain containing protein [Vulcanisaeta moutnovskia 768-28]